MRTYYITLAVTPDGQATVLMPTTGSGSNVTATCIPLSDLQDQGLNEGSALIGLMLIGALCAYHPDLDRQALAPDKRRAMPYRLTFDNRPEIRPQRMGLGVENDATGPAMLTIGNYHGDEPIGVDQLHSLKQLVELGKDAAPSFIAEIMLRKLAARHPDVLPPLFPTIFAPGSSPA